MRIIVHWNGCSYYYATESGQQISKAYKKLHNLRKYGRVNHI